MVTHNCGYLKFGSSFKFYFIFSNFGQVNFVVFNFVGTQNMWVFKSVDDQILYALKIGGN